MRRVASAGETRFAHRRVMVIGASSEIAAAIVDELPPCPDRELALLGRGGGRLHKAAEQLTATGARAHEIEVDAREHSTHRAAVDRAVGLLGGLDLVIVAVGILGERGAAPEDIPAAAEVLAVNTAGAGSLLLESARVLRGQGHGSIVVLSSVAAERPRASNAVYCASKAGLDSLAQALSEDLEPAGVKLLVVRPGFVRTRMTVGLPVPAGATDAQTVARATVRGLARGASTVWAPAQLRWVMIVIRLLPRTIMRRLPL
jgi:decaprenylphospho-beta-D-erythro-pentofuranosid-2-ulose 2-reductase